MSRKSNLFAHITGLRLEIPLPSIVTPQLSLPEKYPAGPFPIAGRDCIFPGTIRRPLPKTNPAAFTFLQLHPFL
jgi:hypothetical protein